jgi:hypothetical protein
MADGWCWFVLREEYCWLVAGGWFVLREKYCWLVADKPSEQGGCRNLRLGLGSSDGGKQPSGSLERTTRDFFIHFFYHDFAKIYDPPEILQNYTLEELYQNSM